MADMYIQTGTLVVLISLFGMTSARECIACQWNAKNSSLEDNCLGAPFKTKTAVCQEAGGGQRIGCQTLAVFNKKTRSLESLERKCGSKHSKCNNACTDDVTNCWLCCDDYDKCNGFPLRSNIVVTSTSSANVLEFILSSFVLTTMSVFLSLV